MSNKIIDLIKNGSEKPILSKFLTIAEQAELQSYKKEVNIEFSSLYEDEERKRALIYPKDINITPNFKILPIKIESNRLFQHREILGSLLSLGITREVIGDILVEEQIFFCSSEIADYLVLNLDKIGKNNCKLILIEDFAYSGSNNLIEDKIIVSSMRLDNILSKGFNLSRSDASELISINYAKIDGKIEKRVDFNVKVGQTISLTRHGRIKIMELVNKTKKEKLVLSIQKTKR